MNSHEMGFCSGVKFISSVLTDIKTHSLKNTSHYIKMSDLERDLINVSIYARIDHEILQRTTLLETQISD